MNSHESIRKQLAAYCGNDLSDQECVILEQHLKECPECRAALGDLKIARHLIQTTPEIEPPPWLAAKIMARIRDEQPVSQRWFQNLLFLRNFRIPMEAMALLAICVTGYFLVQNIDNTLMTPVPATRLEQSPPSAPHSPSVAASKEKSISAPSPAAAPAAAAKKAPVDQQSVKTTVATQTPQSAPSFAPSPPPRKQEAAEMEYKGGRAESMKTESPNESRDRVADAPSAAAVAEPSMKRKAARSAEQPAPAGLRMAVGNLKIRLVMNNSSIGWDVVRDVVQRCGGTAVPEKMQQSGRLTAKIPAQHINNLMEQLGRLGKIVNRPVLENLSGVVEIEISW